MSASGKPRGSVLLLRSVEAPEKGVDADIVASRPIVDGDVEVRALTLEEDDAEPGQLLMDDAPGCVELVHEELDLARGVKADVGDPAAQQGSPVGLTHLPSDGEDLLLIGDDGLQAWLSIAPSQPDEHEEQGPHQVPHSSTLTKEDGRRPCTPRRACLGHNAR